MSDNARNLDNNRDSAAVRVLEKYIQDVEKAEGDTSVPVLLADDHITACAEITGGGDDISFCTDREAYE